MTSASAPLPPISEATDRRRHVFWAGLALVIIIVLVYADSIRAPFLFDDLQAVTNNLTIRRLFSWDVLRPPTGTTLANHPVANLTLALNFALSGEAPWSYHATNIVIHVFCALLAFGIVRRTLRNPRATTLRLESLWTAFAIVLLWAVHPLLTETVMNVGQRAESLGAFFYLLTVYAFVRGAEVDAVVMPTSLAPEPSGVVPPLAGTVEVTSPGASAGAVPKMSSAAPFSVPGVSAAVIKTAPVFPISSSVGPQSALARSALAAPSAGRVGDTGNTAAAEPPNHSELSDDGLTRAAPTPGAPNRVQVATIWYVVACVGCLLGMGTKATMATAPLVVLLYDRTWLSGSFRHAWRQRGGVYLSLGATWVVLMALLWHGPGVRAVPSGAEVSALHGVLIGAESLLWDLKQAVWPHPLLLDHGAQRAFPNPVVWSQLVVVAGMVIATIWAVVRQRIFGFLAAAFMIVLLPVSSLVAHPMAEHRMYLPLILIVGLGVGAVIRFRRFGTAGVMTLTWALAAVAIARIHAYHDPLALWTTNVVARPTAVEARHHRAVLLAASGNTAAASAEFARAVARAPRYLAARLDWGSLLFDRGQYPEAVEQLKAAVALAPNLYGARVKLATALVRAGRPAEAVAHFAAALRLRPSADLHYELGVALLNVGNTRDATEQFDAALAERPGLVDAHYQLSVAAAKAGDVETERRELRQTVTYAPTNVIALRRLGVLEANSGNMTAAAEYLRTVVGLDPSDFNSLANLGDVLLVDGRVNEAIGCYQLALRLRPDDAKLKENLAIAHAALEQGTSPTTK